MPPSVHAHTGTHGLHTARGEKTTEVHVLPLHAHRTCRCRDSEAHTSNRSGSGGAARSSTLDVAFCVSLHPCPWRRKRKLVSVVRCRGGVALLLLCSSALPTSRSIGQRCYTLTAYPDRTRTPAAAHIRFSSVLPVVQLLARPCSVFLFLRSYVARASFSPRLFSRRSSLRRVPCSRCCSLAQVHPDVPACFRL